MSDDAICIGRVLKPQGIVGEIKIKDEISGYSTVKHIKTVIIDGIRRKVLNTRYFGGALYLTVSGVSDRNAAELLRGKEVYALRSEMTLGENEFFIVDVIGCELKLSSGKILGKITDVAEGRVDVYTVETAEGSAVFPMLKALEPVYDLAKKTVTVNAKKFTEVVLYEN